MESKKTFLLRIDPKLWQELEAWSQEELRSINGQIEYLLRLAVNQRKKRSENSPYPAAPQMPPYENG